MSLPRFLAITALPAVPMFFKEYFAGSPARRLRAIPVQKKTWQISST
jgi:hypothetical protein